MPKTKTKNQKVKPSGSSTVNPRTTSSASYVGKPNKGRSFFTPFGNPYKNTLNSPLFKSPVGILNDAQNITSGKTAVQGPPIITATGAPAGSQNIPYPNGTMYPDKAAPPVAPATNIRTAQVTSKTPTKTIGASTDVDDVQTMNQVNAFNASIASLSSNVAKNTATIQQLAAQDQQARNQAQADALNAQYSSAAPVDQTAAPAATPAPTGGISGFLSGTTGKIVVYGGIAAGAFFFARSRGLLK